MDKFTRLTATACPINQANLNTDQILPARYLKWPRAAGIGKVLFQDLRFDAEGQGAAGLSDQPAGMARRQDRRRRAQLRLRLLARGRGLCAL